MEKKNYQENQKIISKTKIIRYIISGIHPSGRVGLVPIAFSRWRIFDNIKFEEQRSCRQGKMFEFFKKRLRRVKILFIANISSPMRQRPIIKKNLIEN